MNIKFHSSWPFNILIQNRLLVSFIKKSIDIKDFQKLDIFYLVLIDSIIFV